MGCGGLDTSFLSCSSLTLRHLNVVMNNFAWINSTGFYDASEKVPCELRFSFGATNILYPGQCYGMSYLIKCSWTSISRCLSECLPGTSPVLLPQRNGGNIPWWPGRALPAFFPWLVWDFRLQWTFPQLLVTVRTENFSLCCISSLSHLVSRLTWRLTWEWFFLRPEDFSISPPVLTVAAFSSWLSH